MTLFDLNLTPNELFLIYGSLYLSQVNTGSSSEAYIKKKGFEALFESELSNGKDLLEKEV